MYDSAISVIPGTRNGLESAEQLGALREQRRLLDSLIVDIRSTLHRLEIEPGAGAAWQSDAQKQYMMRRLDLRMDIEGVVWVVEEARRVLSVAIAETARA